MASLAVGFTTVSPSLPSSHPSLSHPLRCRPHPPPRLSLPSPPLVLVIGGGAAGFFAGITLARAAGTNADVTILEASQKVLSKVRISGGGRCNVTSGLHHDDSLAFAANYPRGGRAMPAVLSRYGAADVVRFFEGEGVPLKVESTGKVFPVSDSSESVVAALTNAAAGAGVTVRKGARVVDVKPGVPGFDVAVAGGEVLKADFVVVATGSARAAQGWAERMGHQVVAPVPSLFTFRVDDERLKCLAGVAVEECSVTLEIRKPGDGTTKRQRRAGKDAGLTQSGPLLFTHWGLSGPVVLTLSALGARVLHEEGYKLSCVIDWAPSLTLEEKLSLLRSARVTLSQKNLATVSPFRKKFPNRLWRYLIESVPTLSGSQKWSSLRKEHINKVANVLHCSKLLITGKGEFKEEFVTAGGVSLSSINTKTFESKHLRGLYFAGEAVDVDGRTGGYNLEFAWSSGYIAGASIAQKVLETAKLSAST